jgi:hypothetical protein
LDEQAFIYERKDSRFIKATKGHHQKGLRYARVAGKIGMQLQKRQNLGRKVAAESPV